MPKPIFGRAPLGAVLPALLMLAACGPDGQQSGLQSSADASAPKPVGGGRDKGGGVTVPLPGPTPTPTPTPVPTPTPTPGPTPAPSGLRAFPTAEGFGAATVGGRGGQVMIVTNLNDSGAGSLRACVEASGPRVCTFEVSGTIALDNPLVVKQPYLTLAGQTSPGGIALKISPANTKGPFEVWANDVIIRHLRFRPGPSGATSTNDDAIFINAGVRNVIVDHSSLSWSTDELANTLNAGEGKSSTSQVTFQWSMFYEGLSHSTHLSGEHSKGPYLFGNHITFHHNLIASNTRRNPNLSTDGQVDFLNNLVYNGVEQFGELYDRWPIAVNSVGNWVSMGPASRKDASIFGMDAFPEYNAPQHAGFKLYAKDNIGPRVDGSGYLNPNDAPLVQPTPIGTISAPVTSPQQAYMDVLAFAGAFPRDASDTRVAAYVRACQGAVIDNPTQVGGWPTLNGGTAPADADRDGMADAWEQRNGITDGSADKDGDGYTNLEEYLNELAGDQDAAGNVIVRTGTGQGGVAPMNCGFAVR